MLHGVAFRRWKIYTEEMISALIFTRWGMSSALVFKKYAGKINFSETTFSFTSEPKPGLEMNEYYLLPLESEVGFKDFQERGADMIY